MNNKSKYFTPILVVSTLVLFWEFIVITLNIPLYVMPSPTKIIDTLISELNVFLPHIYITLNEALIGLLISLILGFFLAILMDLYQPIKEGVYPLLIISQTVPMIVLAPLFIIYMGFGILPKIVTIVLMCFFPIVISFSNGLYETNKDYVHLIKSFGGKKFDVYRYVKIPSALPSLFSGLSISATYSISGAVVAEWIGSNSGLGYYIIRAKNGFMLDKVYAAVLIIIILSLLLNIIIKFIGYKLCPQLNLKKEDK